MGLDRYFSLATCSFSDSLVVIGSYVLTRGSMLETL